MWSDNIRSWADNLGMCWPVVLENGSPSMPTVTHKHTYCRPGTKIKRTENFQQRVIVVVVNFCQWAPSTTIKHDENLWDEIFLTRKFPDLWYTKIYVHSRSGTAFSSKPSEYITVPMWPNLVIKKHTMYTYLYHGNCGALLGHTYMYYILAIRPTMFLDLQH